jgi:uncharacterized protein YegL
VTFVKGPISRIILFTNSSGDSLVVNTTHLITATVYDKTAVHFDDEPDKWRVMANVTLNFNVTQPPHDEKSSPDEDYNASVAPSSNTTDENGVTNVMMHLASWAGSNILHANATNEEGGQVSCDLVLCGLASNATMLTVTASPWNVSANGIDLSHVTGKITDEFGNPLLSRGAIRFNVTGNDPIIKPLNSVGEAMISIGPSKFTGSVTVNGTYITGAGDYTNITDSVTVIFYEEEPARVVVTADATKISTSNIPGVNISTITATVIDKWGHTLHNRTVNFSLAGPGTLSSATGTTDPRGQAIITLQSDAAGDATVAAKALNDSGYEIGGSIVIHILSGPFISVITTIEPDPIEPGGIINVTTSISGQGNITGNRVAAHAVLTLDRSGSMDPDYYAGTPLDIVEVLDRSGSMSGTPFADARKAATMFLDNMVSNSQVGVVSYATDCTIDHPLTLLNASDNKPLIKDAINALSTGGDTAMGDGMLNASRILTGELDSNARNYSRKIMIVLTDGRTNVGTDPMSALAHAQANDITVYTIGLGSSLDETLLRYIAYETGGKYYNAPESSELQRIYQTIAQEISDYDITAIEYSKEGFTPYDYEESHSLAPRNYTGNFTLQYYAHSIDSNENKIIVTGHDLGYIPSGSGTRSHDISAYVVNGTNTIKFYQTGSDGCYIQAVLILSDNVTIASYPGRFYPRYITGRTYNCTFTTTYYAYNDTFLINETMNDLKTTLDWSGEHDLDLHVTDPDAHVYGEGDDTTGYYFDDRVAAPIDPENYDFATYITSLDPDTNLASDAYFYVCDHYNDSDSIKSSILRFTLPANSPTRNAKIDSVIARMYLYNRYRFRLSFDGYDMDEALSYNYSTYHSGGDGSDPWWDNGTAYTGECRIRLNGRNYTFIPGAPTPANNEIWLDYGYNFYSVADGVNTIDFTDCRGEPHGNACELHLLCSGRSEICPNP